MYKQRDSVMDILENTEASAKISPIMLHFSLSYGQRGRDIVNIFIRFYVFCELERFSSTAILFEPIEVKLLVFESVSEGAFQFGGL